MKSSNGSMILVVLYSMALIDVRVSTSRLSSWRDSKNLATHDPDSDQNQIHEPNAVILSPEGDESMLTESGALSITIQVYAWMSGVMTVHVNQSLVAETTEGYVQDVNDPPQEFNWELYGPQAYGTYTTRVSFYSHHGGKVCTFTRSQ
jgi:hypothetical protein